MPRRWIRYQLPVMVCVEISDTEEREEVTKVVLGAEHADLQLATDLDGRNLVYDQDMECVSVDEYYSRQALPVAADLAGWPAREDWEEGPDALRDPWLYEDGDLGEDDLEGEGEELGGTAATVTAADQPTRRPG